MPIDVVVADETHLKYVITINDEIDRGVKARGTGIARRTDEYIRNKIIEGKAIIALEGDKFVGFCYIESWEHEKFVANSGLIVIPEYRSAGVGKRVKKAAFELSRKKFPQAKLFGLTTSEQVMKINTQLGYVPVPFTKLTDDEQFWNGCKSCQNYDILTRTNKTKCLCTAMVYDPSTTTYKIGIAGGAGYTGGELIRLLIHHPIVQLKYVYSESFKGQPLYAVHQDMLHVNMNFSDIDFSDIDILFLCLSHGQSIEYLKYHTIPKSVKIIDLSQDFRLKQQANGFVYGLPELNRDLIYKSQYIANPGCFATAIQLALLPLATDHILPKEINVFGITGSTGAGQKPTIETHYSMRESNLSNYKVFNHQHLHEISETLSSASATNQLFDIAFVPLRGSLTRGIIVDIIIRTDIDILKLREKYEVYYEHHPFVCISDTPLFIKQVTNTNYCYIHLVQEGHKILITAVIDNLLKGASGQAIQNMNLMLGIEETTGLRLKGNYF
ncbi:MAG: N-acetyl-gamma-glutamyl-phosphate reductase [Chitinophagaceae bacterium]